jgi:hypothetical protein
MQYIRWVVQTDHESISSKIVVLVEIEIFVPEYIYYCSLLSAVRQSVKTEWRPFQVNESFNVVETALRIQEIAR